MRCSHVHLPFCRNPWLCFPFELMEVVTTHLMWNSAATYTAELAPPGLLATTMGLSGMLHYNAGERSDTNKAIAALHAIHDGVCGVGFRTPRRQRPFGVACYSFNVDPKIASV